MHTERRNLVFIPSVVSKVNRWLIGSTFSNNPKNCQDLCSSIFYFFLSAHFLSIAEISFTSFALNGMNIHLIPKWQPVYYSPVYMVISPLCLVNMYKIQKNFEVKMRQRGLIDMRTGEWWIGGHFGIMCMFSRQFKEKKFFTRKVWGFCTLWSSILRPPKHWFVFFLSMLNPKAVISLW